MRWNSIPPDVLVHMVTDAWDRVRLLEDERVGGAAAGPLYDRRLARELGRRRDKYRVDVVLRRARFELRRRLRRAATLRHCNG